MKLGGLQGPWGPQWQGRVLGQIRGLEFTLNQQAAHMGHSQTNCLKCKHRKGWVSR